MLWGYFLVFSLFLFIFQVSGYKIYFLVDLVRGDLGIGFFGFFYRVNGGLVDDWLLIGDGIMVGGWDFIELVGKVGGQGVRGIWGDM